MMFTDSFCDNCRHQNLDPNSKHQCYDVLMRSVIGEQPEEWQFHTNGYPICTKWSEWDWGKGEPPIPEPEDPNQLLFPFSIEELFGFYDRDICVTKKGIFELV